MFNGNHLTEFRKGSCFFKYFFENVRDIKRDSKQSCSKILKGNLNPKHCFYRLKKRNNGKNDKKDAGFVKATLNCLNKEVLKQFEYIIRKHYQKRLILEKYLQVQKFQNLPNRLYRSILMCPVQKGKVFGGKTPFA